MDVCGKLRGILKTKKVGHAGTLDPMATGVLPVFVGSATKAVSFAESGDKEYIAGLRLGVTTDTQDTSGNGVALRQSEPGGPGAPRSAGGGAAPVHRGDPADTAHVFRHQDQRKEAV